MDQHGRTGVNLVRRYMNIILLRDEQGSSDPNSNYVRYDSLRIRFLPAINLWDDLTYYSNLIMVDEKTYYKQISVWTDTWHLIKKSQLEDPVSGQPINFNWLMNTIQLLRGTGTAL